LSDPIAEENKINQQNFVAKKIFIILVI